ncbi:MAG: hypothetical protein QM278_11370 [Pseudomonadota bacterium]|nr:hypothetical protein [Pseudomonadota bacterium]
MQLILFNIGLISLLGQVILLRELAVAAYGVELIYLYALGVWLLCAAAGALMGRRRFVAAGSIAVALIALAILLPAAVTFVRASRLLFVGAPGAYLPFSQQLLIPVLALGPIGLLSGFLFPPAATLYIEARPGATRTLAGAYGIESLGALAGGLLAVLSLQFNLSMAAVTLLTSAFIAMNGLATPRGKGGGSAWLAGALAAAALIALPGASRIDRMTSAWNHSDLVVVGETAYGRIVVTGRSGQAAVFENDVLALETEGIEGETFAHLVALQHPRPRRVLLLGGGTEGIVAALRRHGPERIDVVELNERMVGMVLPQLPPEHRQALTTPPARLVFADPRAFLRGGDPGGRLSPPDNYDLILVAMPGPASGQGNRFYTREFFRICATRLRPGGILGLRLRAAENIWPPPLARRMAAIHRALQGEFPRVLFLPGTTNIVTASVAPLPEDAASLSARWVARGIEARLVRPAYIEYLFANDRFEEIRRRLTETETAANSDLQPVCYRLALQLWLSKFFPRASLLDFSLSRPVLSRPLAAVSLLAVVGLLFLVRTSPAGRRIVLAAVAGFAGMILQNVLLLYYQVKNGALYQDIGLLMASFMAGLALGALLTHRRLPAGKLRRVGVPACFFTLAALIHLILFRQGGLGLPSIAALLALSGFFSGALFAQAAVAADPDCPDGAERHGFPADPACPDDPGRNRGLAAPLYAADLLGGAAGAVLGGLILIPAAGLTLPVAIAAVSILLTLLVV